MSVPWKLMNLLLAAGIMASCTEGTFHSNTSTGDGQHLTDGSSAWPEARRQPQGAERHGR